MRNKIVMSCFFILKENGVYHMNNILIKPVNQFIGGSWEVGSSKKKGTIHNPFNNEVLAEVTLANEVDVNEAYEIAKEALRLAAQKLPVVTKFIVANDFVKPL